MRSAPSSLPAAVTWLGLLARCTRNEDSDMIAENFHLGLSFARRPDYLAIAFSIFLLPLPSEQGVSTGTLDLMEKILIGGESFCSPL